MLNFHRFDSLDSKYGQVAIKGSLKSRQTITLITVNELALKYRADLKNQLTEPVKAKSVTTASDFWSNKYNQ